MSRKAYVAVDCGGEYQEDSWERVVCAFTDRERALRFAASREYEMKTRSVSDYIGTDVYAVDLIEGEEES